MYEVHLVRWPELGSNFIKTLSCGITLHKRHACENKIIYIISVKYLSNLIVIELIL